MRRLLAITAIVAGGLAAPNLSWAGGSIGTILQITHMTAGVAFFDAAGGHPGQPACATLSRWALNVTTPAGQSVLATLLMAYAQGKSVNFVGTGNCDVWPDSESIAYVVLN